MRIDGLCQQVPKYFSVFCFGPQKPSTNGCPLFLPVDHMISSGKYFSLLRVHRGFRQARSLGCCITVIFSSRASSASKHPSLRKKNNNIIRIMIMIIIIIIHTDRGLSANEPNIVIKDHANRCCKLIQLWNRYHLTEAPRQKCSISLKLMLITGLPTGKPSYNFRFRASEQKNDHPGEGRQEVSHQETMFSALGRDPFN